MSRPVRRGADGKVLRATGVTRRRPTRHDDREFPDPDPQMSVEQVKATLSDFYGEIANASVKETGRGEDTIYEFQRRVGTKGAFTRALN